VRLSAGREQLKREAQIPLLQAAPIRSFTATPLLTNGQPRCGRLIVPVGGGGRGVGRYPASTRCERFRRYPLVVWGVPMAFVSFEPGESASGAPNGLPLAAACWPERPPLLLAEEVLNGRSAA